jgi:hypothetical protein
METIKNLDPRKTIRAWLLVSIACFLLTYVLSRQSLYYEYKNNCQAVLFNKHARDELIYFLINSSAMTLLSCTLANMNLYNLMRIIKAYNDKRHKILTFYYPFLFVFIFTLLMPVFAVTIYIAIVVNC